MWSWGAKEILFASWLRLGFCQTILCYPDLNFGYHLNRKLLLLFWGSTTSRLSTTQWSILCTTSGVKAGPLVPCKACLFALKVERPTRNDIKATSVLVSECHLGGITLAHCPDSLTFLGLPFRKWKEWFFGVYPESLTLDLLVRTFRGCWKVLIHARETFSTNESWGPKVRVKWRELLCLSK